MHSATQHPDFRPWYREPWPWFILGLLGLGIVAGSTLAVIGISSPPDMVTGEYERLGRGMTDGGTRSAQARALGLTGTVRLDGAQVVIELQTGDGVTLPETLLVLFQHPAEQERDTTTRAAVGANGHYGAELASRPHPRSYVIVTDVAQSWWLSARLTGNVVEAVELRPRRL